ncbi:hypothetical protein GN244_ATG12851 [Phytophthora infestans]|uniref:RxLR effector PexRD54 WY domain-containing protein n=1 Tax=Phytophthora infestans TaxID=4787 RepID=A0A833RXB1_PHYIN|nr:hypothetical protein GN244_ATG12851 [Phytophthora infestans]
MHLLHQAMLLFAAFFFLNVDAESKVRSLNRAVSKNPINRYLRVVSDDERGYISSLGLEKTQEWISSLVKKIIASPKPTQDNIPDETLSHVLNAVSPLKNSISAATKHQSPQIQMWLNEGKSTGEVFKLLELKKFTLPNFKIADGTLFDQPSFHTWVQYVDDFNAKNPMKQESMTPSLLTVYSDAGLSEALALAKKGPTTEALATKLRKEHIQWWLKDDKTPETVFKLFMLDEKVDDLLTNPQFVAWTKYINHFNVKHPGKETSMVFPIAAHYGDDALFGVLEAAKKVQSTKELASKLQVEQIKKLLSSNESPTYVFKAFNLDKTGDTVLDSPLFKTWLNYMKTFNDQNPRKIESMLTSIHRYYDQDNGVAKIVDEAMKNPRTETLAKELQAERYNRWLAGENSPESAFNAFVLHRPGASDDIHFKKHPGGTLHFTQIDNVSDDLLSSADFTFWKQYLDDFNTMYPDNQASMLKILQTFYTDEALKKLLDTARKNPRTQELASNLEAAMSKV